MKPKAMLMAGGQPIAEAVADQAAHWLTLWMSDEMSAPERERFAQWRRAHPDHERAWLHLEAARGRIQALQPAAAYQALSPYQQTATTGRRQALRALCWVGGLGGAGWLALRSPVGQQWVADYRTAVGEQRQIALSDGTVLTLNTDSAVNQRFDAQQRRLLLLSGEIMVVTAHANANANPGRSDARPLIVATAQAQVRALGTRFVVRQRREHTEVAVFQSAVEITTHSGAKQVLQAGEQATVGPSGIRLGAPLDLQADAAWVRGQLVVSDMRLADFVAELSRYRRGILRCAPEVADWRLSGVFPLPDTDRILATLPNVLPVQVALRTRYWVTVEQRGAGADPVPSGAKKQSVKNNFS